MHIAQHARIFAACAMQFKAELTAYTSVAVAMQVRKHLLSRRTLTLYSANEDGEHKPNGTSILGVAR